MPLLIILMPANVVVVFRGFSDVINLEILDKQTIYDFSFGRFVPNKILENNQSSRRILTAESFDSSPIQRLGYAQSDTIRDLLLAVLAVSIFVVLVAILMLIKKFFYRCLPLYLKRTFNSIWAFLMWDKVLAWTTETYQATAIGALYAVKTFRNLTSRVSKVTVSLEVLYLFIWPAMIFLILYRNRS